MAHASGDGPGQPRRASSPVASRRRTVSAGGNPTIRQRELGIRLRELRDAAGLSVEEVGVQLECSASKISRLETGSRRANPRDVRDLCAIYGLTDQAQVDDLMNLARLAREPGWWSQYDAVLSPYIGLEQEAVAITAFSMYAVPALLQTSDYARVTIRGIERKMDPAVLGQLAQARLRRQELLDRDRPPRYRALLDEAVLHREMGSPAVMSAQLGTILTCAAQDKVTVQVIPFSVGAHASIDSNFVLLEFDESSPQGPVVFVEGLFTNGYLEKRAEIDRYREALEYLRDAALSPRDSISLITEIGNRYARLPGHPGRVIRAGYPPSSSTQGGLVSRNVTPPGIPPSARASLAWRVARDCDAGTCIGVAPHHGMIVIGDTKNPDGPVLSYSHDEWVAFVKGIRQGDFDDLL